MREGFVKVNIIDFNTYVINNTHKTYNVEDVNLDQETITEFYNKDGILIGIMRYGLIKETEYLILKEIKERIPHKILSKNDILTLREVLGLMKDIDYLGHKLYDHQKSFLYEISDRALDSLIKELS